MEKKSFAIILAIVLITAVVPGCLTSQKGPKEINIGHIAPLTGDAAVYGEWETQGINLAVEEINAKGGINGMQIKVIHEDDQLDPKTGASALNKLITVDKVPAVIGATASSITLAIAQLLKKIR